MLKPLFALLLSAGLLLAGSGLQGTLISVRAHSEGMSIVLIGLMMSAYYAGFVFGCLRTPSLVSRAGHIRTFATLAAVAAATALIYPIHVNIALWLALRALTGFCFAGLYMVIESWISERAEAQMRARVLSVYRMVDLAAMTAGQCLLNVAPPSGTALFSLVGILTCLAIAPVGMTKAIAPDPLTPTQLHVAKLLRVSPFAVVGAFAAGLANAAVWALGPVYVQSLGYDLPAITVFISAIIIGGFLGQWPLGALSDLTDRRIILLWTAGAACLFSIFAASLGAASLALLIISAALFGVCGMSIFGLSAAHANDHAESDEFVAISGGLLLVFGIGSVLGPALAPSIMAVFTKSGLFIYVSLIYAALFAFGVVRIFRAESVPKQDQEDYVVLQPTSPLLEMDPRNETIE